MRFFCQYCLSFRFEFNQSQTTQNVGSDKHLIQEELIRQLTFCITVLREKKKTRIISFPTRLRTTVLCYARVLCCLATWWKTAGSTDSERQDFNRLITLHFGLTSYLYSKLDLGFRENFNHLCRMLIMDVVCKGAKQ